MKIAKKAFQVSNGFLVWAGNWAPAAQQGGYRAGSSLLQLFVFFFRFDEDGDVFVGVFPEREKILVGFLGFGAIAGERRGAREADVGERIVHVHAVHAGMIED